MKNITLSNGTQMPMVGYGTLLLRDPGQCYECVRTALSLGYRLIDTAASYENEAAIGEAIKDSGIKRSELFITSKLWIQDSGETQAGKAYEASLKRLGLDYLDLYLIHQPFGDYYGSWRAIEALYREKRVRAIGVSNFLPDRLVDLSLNSEITPMLDQLETHPFFGQREALPVLKKYGVTPQAWAPFAEGLKDIFRHPTLKKIAEANNRTAAQVILRWNIQRGIPVIPKSTRAEHMKENLEVMDFELSEADVKEIEALDIGHSEIVDHRSACTARQLNNWTLQTI